MAALVEFRDVCCRFDDREVLRNVNLTVEAGETLVLLGRSGSGKTTLLKTVNRLVEPSRGEVWFDGRAVRQWDPVQLRRRIGYVIQEGGLLPHRSVLRNVGLVPELEGWAEDRKASRVADVLGAVGLPVPVYGDRKPRQLSGGERQRVGIARALAANPPLLLLDEPFASLDPVTRYELQQHFLHLRRSLGTTVIFVTHDIREALLMATRIALLRAGNVEFVEPPAEFRNGRSEEARAFLATLDEDREPRAAR